MGSGECGILFFLLVLVVVSIAVGMRLRKRCSICRRSTSDDAATCARCGGWHHLRCAPACPSVPRQERATACVACTRPLGGDLVRCPRCSAVHHSSCWRTAGGCRAANCASAHPSARREGPAAACVACAGPPGTSVVRCPRCSAMHHSSCWASEGGCSAPACKSGDGVEIVESPAPPARFSWVPAGPTVSVGTPEPKPSPPGPDMPSVGLCQVCGAGMTSDLVQCRKCRTPHHRSCWSYLGKCSTFACVSKHADPLVAAPRQEEIVILDEEPRQGKNRVRVWMEQLADRYRDGPVQRECPKRGRYLLRLERSGIHCVLEGKKSSGGWRVWFHARLTPEQQDRVRSTPAEGLLRRAWRKSGELTLEPAVPPERFEQLQGFFEACLRVVNAAGSRR